MPATFPGMSREWSIALAGLLAAIALGVLLLGGEGKEEGPGPTPPADVRVTVSLSEAVRTRGSMNGFIHSLDGALPPDSRVVPLAPRLWRSDGLRAPIDRATGFGAGYQLVLSDLWGYPQSDWGGRGAPWRDLGAWERFVRRTARTHRGQPVQWDIWNEANDPGFWSGGRRRFFEVYSVANRVLRQELGPGVSIGGPSISRYAPRWLRAFLDHCLAARCRLDFLSWHENLEASDPLDSISAHLTDGRKQFLDQPRYAALGLGEIHVNEYVGREDRHLPGEAVAYLAQLERGGADRAARSCWSREDCSPAGLDGLLTADGSPRAVWWAHRWYADGLGSRVKSRSDDPAVAVLASAQAPGRAHVLLGHVAPRGSGARSAAKAIEVALEGLGPRGRAQLTIDRVAAAGEAPVPRPERIAEREVEIDAGSLRLAVPALGVNEAALVRLSPLAE